VLVAAADARAKSLAGLVEQAAEGALDASDRFQALRGIDAFDATAAAARATKENEARGLAADAQKALEELDSAKATKLYSDAVVAWRSGDLSRNLDALVEAQLGKAAGHATSSENPQAKAELDKALLLSPKAKLSDANFTPELLKYADGQRTKLAKAKGKLTVRTEPPGARVWVDGSFRGASPVTVEGLGAGPHVVNAGLTGWALATEELALGDHLVKLKPAEAQAQVQAGLDRIVADPEGPGRDSAARELGQAARADQVLVLVVKKGQAAEQLELGAVRIDPVDGHVFASKPGSTVVPNELKGLTDFVSTVLATDEPKPGGSSSASSGAKGRGGGGLSGMRIAGIGLLGGAVAAAASWAIFGISALGKADLYKSTFQVETMKANQAISDGRTFALVADISWAVGAAFLIAGVLLVILGGSSSGGARGGPAAKPAGGGDDAMQEYRRHQEEQRRAEEERQKKAAETPPAEEKKPEEAKPAGTDEKKPEEAKPAAAEEKKKLTPEEEKAEKKRLADEAKKKAEDEKAEKKRLADEAKKKAEEEKAEKKRKADEEKAEKKRLADEAKKKAEEEKAEKKRLADEEKKKAEEEKAEKKRLAEEEKKKAEEDKARAEEEKKRAAEDEEKKKKEDEQRKADEEARRMDEERRAKDEAEKRREEERKKNDDRPKEPNKKNDLEEDLRDDR
ncbi:MAG: PEGA domain-containing protein, partial [Myxococcaceae bacterium]|nr:PEGA domain-containing protein [Myxococcaceae bacterium]